MTRAWMQDEPIDIETDPQGRLRAMRWHGQRHAIERLVEWYQIDLDWWSSQGHVRRNYYTVITRTGLLCVLYYDFLSEGWSLARLYD